MQFQYLKAIGLIAVFFLQACGQPGTEVPRGVTQNGAVPVTADSPKAPQILLSDGTLPPIRLSAASAKAADTAYPSGCNSNNSTWFNGGSLSTSASLVNFFSDCVGGMGWAGNGKTSDPYRFQLDNTNSNAAQKTSVSIGASNLSLLGSYTISLWIKPMQNVVYNVMATRALQNDFTYYQFFLGGLAPGSPGGNGKIQFSRYAGSHGYSVIHSNRTYASLLNQWHHVVAVYKVVPGSQYGGEMSLYIDGSADNANVGAWHSDNTTAVASPISIGAPPSAPASWGTGFKGDITEVHIYDQALTPTQIRELCLASVQLLDGQTCP